jgi:HemY protein
MRSIIWLLTLFAVAVALALAAKMPSGLVSLFIGGYRLDLSMNLAVIALVFFYAMLYLSTKGISTLLELPKIAKRWRLVQKERSTHASFLSALEQLMTGRYVRSMASSAQAIESAQALQAMSFEHTTPPAYLDQLIGLAHLIGAESAHALRDVEKRDQHLNSVMNTFTTSGSSAPHEIREASLLSAARWSLADGQAQSALGSLNELRAGVARRTLALRLRLKSDRLAHHPSAALETARLLFKHGAFSQTGAQGVIKSLCIASLNECLDPSQLQRTWSKFSAHERSLTDVCIHAGTRAIELSAGPQTALNWISPVWELWRSAPHALNLTQKEKLTDTMSRALQALGPDKHWLAKIDQATMSHPGEIHLHFLFAMTCMHNSLWGKTQQLMQELVPKLDQVHLKKQALHTLAQLAAQRGDEGQAMAHWKSMAQLDAKSWA